MKDFREITVFSKEWFEHYQDKLLWFANTKFGRYTLRIHGDRSDVGNNKITKIEPHAITWREGKAYKTEFRTHAKFSKRLYHAFKPVWYILHGWDMLVANKLDYALNVGFDTLTAYPDNTNTVSGTVGRINVNETFSTIRSGAGNISEYQTSNMWLYYQHTSTTTNQYFNMYRGVAIFDTSSIDVGSVASAQLSFYVLSKRNDLATSPSVDIVNVNPASDTSLTDGDYNTYNDTVFSTIAYSSISTGAYNDFTLNVGGIFAINRFGNSSFGTRSSWDTSNSPATWSAGRIDNMSAYTSIETGTSKDPKLTVTYFYSTYVTYSSSDPYASGSMKYKPGGTWLPVSSSDIYFSVNTTSGATTVAYNSQDPSDILKSVLDNFNDYGGTVTYDGTSIDDTNTTVSYTFVTQSILDCANKVLELAPSGWYWYVDPATNLFHFHQKTGYADHLLTLGKDIKEMSVQKRSEGIVNTIFFRGGDTGGGSFLYKKYQDSDSVNIHGIRSQVYVDQRVTVSATADTIANAIIEGNKAPEIRLVGELSDSNIDGDGYDIESVQIGDVINVGNVSGNTSKSLWDKAQWDVAKWDYDITSISSMYLQITRKEYSPNGLNLYCSTTPPDVSKRIEDINRNLQASQTADNPSTPS